MKLKLLTIAVTYAVILSSCAGSSGVVELGPDAYTISTHASGPRGGSVEAQKMALSKAKEFCARADKDLLVTTIKTTEKKVDVDFRL